MIHSIKKCHPWSTITPRLYMTQWENFAKHVNKFESKGKGQLPYKVIGDWVAVEKGTTREFIGRVLGYLLSKQMANFPKIADNPEDVRTSTDLADAFRSKIINRHIAEDGSVTGDAQAGYPYLTRYSLRTPIGGLDHAAASFEAPYGLISNRWERKNGKFHMNLIIPPNIRCLIVPSGSHSFT